jgi:NADH dehydrogenase/NADH:ubiquinone oxidoreductase subunit G
MIRITVDGKEIQTEPGKTILQACLENGIYIPNLCFLETREQPRASCRLCFVETSDAERPVTACTETVRDGLVVRTKTEAVRRLQRTAFKLIMSAHHCTPKTCPVAKPCPLMRIARHIQVGLNPRPLETLERDVQEEVDLTFFTHYPFRCVMCGKCLDVCRERNERNPLTFAKRGFDTVVTFFGSGASNLPCDDCGACVAVCPTGALIPKPPPSESSAVNSSGG